MVKSASNSTSVVIPVHGNGEILYRAIYSIFKQVSLPSEVIVVDDASPVPIILPSSPTGAWPFELKLIRLVENGGGGVARNAGVAVSSGHYVAFLDYDDMMHPDYLRVLNETWSDAGSDVGAIVVGFFWCDEAMRPYRKQSVASQTIIDTKSLLERGNFVGGCSVISVRREAFLSAGGFPAFRACQDWGLLLNIAKRDKIKSLPEPYIFYMSPTFNSNSITRSYRRAILSVCAIYRVFDPLERGRSYQNKSGLIAYHLMRGGRKPLAFKIIKYSYSKFGTLSRLLAKALYVNFVPIRMQLLLLRLRSAVRGN